MLLKTCFASKSNNKTGKIIYAIVVLCIILLLLFPVSWMLTMIPATAKAYLPSTVLDLSHVQVDGGFETSYEDASNSGMYMLVQENLSTGEKTSYVTTSGKIHEGCFELGDGEYKISIGAADPTTKKFYIVKSAAVSFENRWGMAYWSRNAWMFESSSGDLARTAESITDGYTTTEEKAAAIRNWIAKHGTYDHALADSLGVTVCGHAVSADSTFENTNGICTDWSALYGAMLHAIGIPAVELEGSVSSEDHMWCAVYDSERETWVESDPTRSLHGTGNAVQWDIVGTQYTCDDDSWMQSAPSLLKAPSEIDIAM